MTSNGTFTAFGVYKKTSLLEILRVRIVLQFIWTVLISLSSTGWIFTFGEGFMVPAKNFFAIWATYW